MINKRRCGIYIIVLVIIMLALPLEPNRVFAEGKISNFDFCQKYLYFIQDGDLNGYYKYVKSIDGKYQENGLKIYCALDGKTRTIKKEGKYSIVVGGKTNKKDEGNIKFIAPSSGTYKFTFDVRDNVAKDAIIIKQKGNGDLIKAKVDYLSAYSWIGHVKQSTIFLLEGYRDSSCSYYTKKQGYLGSNMRTITGNVYLKKGQYIRLNGRSDHAVELPISNDYEPEEAYNFAGYDLTIKKVNK